MNAPQAFVDLHLHSNRSDGSDPPVEVARRAAALGIAAIALTDHDTVAGNTACRVEAERLGVEFLDGVEISAGIRDKEFHILGLGVDPGSPELIATLRMVEENRVKRAHLIMKKLQALDIPIDPERVFARGEGASGRMHIAQELHEMGYADTVQAAFDTYIGGGKKAFIPKKTLSIEAAITGIHNAGGLAFLAHPGIGNTKQWLPKLMAFAFDGVEAFHSKHTPGQVDEFITLAQENGLLVTGGSDCHGTAGAGPEMGKVRMPYRYYEEIVARLGGD